MSMLSASAGYKIKITTYTGTLGDAQIFTSAQSHDDVMCL